MAISGETPSVSRCSIPAQRSRVGRRGGRLATAGGRILRFLPLAVARARAFLRGTLALVRLLLGGLLLAAVAAFGEIASVAALEVGLVPAAALQPEAGRRDALAQRRLTARWAVLQRGLAQLLQRIQRVAAGFAFVLVDRHRTDRPRGDSDRGC